MSERAERLKRALSTRRRPRTALGRLRLLWHDFVTHGLFGPGGEHCQDCGKGYVLWHAEGDLWGRIRGEEGGLSCPSCFDRRAREASIIIEFRAIPFPSPFGLLAAPRDQEFTITVCDECGTHLEPSIEGTLSPVATSPCPTERRCGVYTQASATSMGPINFPPASREIQVVPKSCIAAPNEQEGERCS